MIPAAQIPSSLPQHIREQDQAIWKSWMDSRNVSSVDAKRVYVRHLRGFYECIEKPIREASENDIVSYELGLRAAGGLSPVTIGHMLKTVRNYWTFARQGQEVSKP